MALIVPDPGSREDWDLCGILSQHRHLNLVLYSVVVSSHFVILKSSMLTCLLIVEVGFVCFWDCSRVSLALITSRRFLLYSLG